jgi:hypothetical protein
MKPKKQRAASDDRQVAGLAPLAREIPHVNEWDPPKRLVDGQRGRMIRGLISQLEQLIKAYQANRLPQQLTA